MALGCGPLQKGARGSGPCVEYAPGYHELPGAGISIPDRKQTGQPEPRALFTLHHLCASPKALSSFPEGIQPAQGGLAEAFGPAFSFGAAAAMDGLAVGFEPSVDHGPAAEDDALSEVPDPSGEDESQTT